MLHQVWPTQQQWHCRIGCDSSQCVGKPKVSTMSLPQELATCQPSRAAGRRAPRPAGGSLVPTVLNIAGDKKVFRMPRQGRLACLALWRPCMLYAHQVRAVSGCKSVGACTPQPTPRSAALAPSPSLPAYKRELDCPQAAPACYRRCLREAKPGGHAHGNAFLKKQRATGNRRGRAKRVR